MKDPLNQWPMLLVTATGDGQVLLVCRTLGGAYSKPREIPKNKKKKKKALYNISIRLGRRY